MNEVIPLSANGSGVSLPDRPNLGGMLVARPELAKGLIAAMKACKPVVKDATNTFHRYAYASSEAIIEEGKAALEAGGLCLLPVETTINGSEKTGPNRYELQRKFLLMHISGESIPLVTNWPVCEDKGRPLDKAAASADTLALAYLLRDLLLMPRVDDDDVAARDDRQHQSQQRPARKAQQPANGDAPPNREKTFVEKLTEADAIFARKGWCDPGELHKDVFAFGVKRNFPSDMAEWTPEQQGIAGDEIKRLRAAAETREAEAISDAEVLEVSDLLLKSKRKWDDVRHELKLGKNARAENLTRAQFAAVKKHLKGGNS
jgi:hypothetical protein